MSYNYNYNQPPYQQPGQNPAYPGYAQPQYGAPGGFMPGMPPAQQYAPPPGAPPIPGNRPQSGAGPASNGAGYYPPPQGPPPPGPPPGHQASYFPPPPAPGPGPYGYAPPPGPPPGPPPVQQPYGYGYAPPGGYMPMTQYLGTPIPLSAVNKYSTDPPVPGYDARGDVEAIHKATKGFGTDESQLIRTLAPLNALQVATLATQYKAAKGRDLAQLIDKETGSWFGMGLRGIVLGPLGWDVELLHRAIAGVGTHEDLLNEILLSRTNDEMNMLKSAYRDHYGRDAEQDVSNDLSMKTKNLFVMAMNASRVPDNVPVNAQQVTADVNQLFNAGVGRKGTNEMVFCEIMVNRSGPHLAAISAAYHAKHKMTLTRAIKKEFSGHMKDALLYIAEGAKRDGRGVWRDAKLLERSMAGLGTKDERLVWRVVRAHWDRQRMEAIKASYQAKYKKSLAARIKGETSGDYQKLMLQLVG
ncbi:hypothetical protein PC9H_000584 [Pleurotus ostreatus]|uniref:Annexin n=2 Tax=Pleurotus ostreatus TaxID=5322 RepID=A0A8H7DWY8_PLEOS|nr:uncharacterized protein PC9H_000584 [Pleurotus ostreatus]KAF7440240.1 hypothetical protein PC9H_000584 [Pleurotus ostreatus]KAJ8700472.1 hypothetical protein PTI98_003490 [Pleurotus ostreatus]